MTAAADVARAAGAALGAEVRAVRPVPGGDLNDAFALDLAGGGTAFAKTAREAFAGSYAAEAAGLRWLAEPGAVALPEVLAVVDPPPGEPHSGPRLLVLAWIDEGPPGRSADEALGRGLALLHAAGAPAYGPPAPGTPPEERAAAPPLVHDPAPAAAAPPGHDPAPPAAAAPPAHDPAPAAAAHHRPLRLGPLILPGTAAPTWAEAYADLRLRPLIRRAADAGALPSGAVERLERVCARLPELAGPPEPPARLHGDLWSGNVLHDAAGRPLLIDPAAYGGHREVDLAMLRLFGSPSPRLLAAYEDVAPLADGHQDRVALWQLFPLLVHAVLFGGSYGAAVDRAARRYA